MALVKQDYDPLNESQSKQVEGLRHAVNYIRSMLGHFQRSSFAVEIILGISCTYELMISIWQLCEKCDFRLVIVHIDYEGKKISSLLLCWSYALDCRLCSSICWCKVIKFIMGKEAYFIPSLSQQCTRFISLCLLIEKS